MSAGFWLPPAPGLRSESYSQRPSLQPVTKRLLCGSGGRDGKVRKSVERIFSIWEERSVYPEEVIAQFKAGLNRKEKEREKPKEKEKDKEKEREKEKEKEKVAQPGKGKFFFFCFASQ